MKVKKRVFAHFQFLQMCENTGLLATLNFERIFKTQRHATVKGKLQKNAS